MTKGIVIQFRQGKRTYKPRHFLIEILDINSREKAKKFVGKKVEWKSSGKEPKIISGEVASAHGNKGVLRAIFEKGLPGQAIGTEVEIK
ncbi:MAG: 50S ribosomal protein L35ae [Candidatus Pacearchaeota archaeon]